MLNDFKLGQNNFAILANFGRNWTRLGIIKSSLDILIFGMLNILEMLKRLLLTGFLNL